jgi:hypothetical protein
MVYVGNRQSDGVSSVLAASFITRTLRASRRSAAGHESDSQRKYLEHTFDFELYWAL